MKELIPVEIIERKIYLIRGHKVMLSSDLAELYGVEPRVLVQAVKRKRLLQAINLSREALKYEHLLIEEANEPYTANKPRERIRFKEKVREAGFRHVIMSIYNYTCSVCNIRILTLEGASVVDAAHIIPFSVSANDDIRNGIALCKLHHWSFDEGLISIDDSYRVMITPLLSAQRPTEWLLTELKDKQIMLPQNETLYPAQEALHYHRENKFLK